jgi:hypothetical protein
MIHHIYPVFGAPYPLLPGWEKTASQVYQTLRDGYNKLLQDPVDKKSKPATAAPPK